MKTRQPLKGVFRLLALGFVLLPFNAAWSEDTGNPAPGEEAYRFLEKYCHSCHGMEFKVEEFDILDREGLIATNDPPPYITPGHPEESYLWERLSKGEMPPPKKADLFPTVEEVAAIKVWIESGAPFPLIENRTEKPSQVAPEVNPVIENPPPAPIPEAAPPLETRPQVHQPPPVPDADPAQFAAGAASVFEKYCYRCHGIEFKKEGLDVLDREVLVDPGFDPPFVVPGDPKKSLLWHELEIDEMPPRKVKERPSQEEKEIVLQWILAGAPPFPESAQPQRAFVAERELLEKMVLDLRGRDENDRLFRRYFSIAPLYNNPANDDETLELYRAAFSKLLNSLTWQSDLVIPEVIDQEGTLLAIDLRDLLWDSEGQWDAILAAYPYGLIFDSAPDPETRRMAEEVYRLTNCQLPYVRLDWFVFAASQPPLYHQMLNLPDTALELEEKLQVDVFKNFERGAAVRAGFAQSGVSTQNRVVERHRSQFGAYWISYDFASDAGTSNIFQNPLGPRTFPSSTGLVSNPYENIAFEPAGGEIIFNLPNGLQAYLLVDADKNRIDEGPIDVVSDINQTVGHPTVVNGVSCMACHKDGMRTDFKDEIRGGSGVFADALVKVQELYPPMETLNSWLEKDRDRFLTANLAAIKPFIHQGRLDREGLETLKEPITQIFVWYQADLSPEIAAIELGFPTPELLMMAIKANPDLKVLGLGALAQGGFLQRETWDSLQGVTSVFQKTAVTLEAGTPFRSF